MPLRCILIPTAPSRPIERRLDMALRFGRRTGAHITALFVRPDPDTLADSFPDIARVAALDRATIDRSGKAAANEARAAFEAWCMAHKVPLSPGHRLDQTFATWREDVGDLASLTALVGRVNDLIVVEGQRGTDIVAAGALDASIFSSGRPALVVPETLPDDPLRHVMVAWNGSLESTRAVSQSLSLLHNADKVSIFTSPTQTARDSAAADLADYLRWHGVVANTVVPASRDFGSVGEALLAACDESGVSLLIMGAYTRSRVREIFLGGVTRHVLAHADLPVILAY